MIQIPRRSFKVDVDGKIFTCRELSAGYLKAVQDGADDTASLALTDSIEDITDEDRALFGRDTEAQIYMEIVKFTFQEPLSGADVVNIEKTLGLKSEEIQTLSRSAKEELKALLKARENTLAKENESKKPLQS